MLHTRKSGTSPHKDQLSGASQGFLGVSGGSIGVYIIPLEKTPARCSASIQRIGRECGLCRSPTTVTSVTELNIKKSDTETDRKFEQRIPLFPRRTAAGCSPEERVEVSLGRISGYCSNFRFSSIRTCFAVRILPGTFPS
jgi:hypothetical protein